jgi:hypothetical protein
VLDIGRVDPVFQGRLHNLHDVKSTLTLLACQHKVDARSCGKVALRWSRC